jgi:hypothetical protein
LLLTTLEKVIFGLNPTALPLIFFPILTIMINYLGLAAFIILLMNTLSSIFKKI